jgi:hypothetical protein
MLKYIVMFNRLMKRKLKCNWFLFDWKATLSYGGRENFRTEVSVVIFFPHGRNLNQR